MANALKNFWNNRIKTMAIAYEVSWTYHHRVLKLDWPFEAVKSCSNTDGRLRYVLEFKDTFFEYSIIFQVERGNIDTTFYRQPIGCRDYNYVSLCLSWLVDPKDENIYTDERGNLRYACKRIPEVIRFK